MRHDEVTFAVIGDIHGAFGEAWCALHDVLNESAIDAEQLAAIFAVGDVEPLRSEAEMGQVHGPAKYRNMGDFRDVMSGATTFPAPLYFIGGNHEPWRALDEDGGLVKGAGQWAPGVWFLGRAGVLDVAGLRVAFLSGIHSPVVSRELARNRPQPASRKQDEKKRRTYWVDEEIATVVREAKRQPVDLLLTHDWPAGIGVNRTGSPTGDEHVRQLVDTIKPSLSCHGHMHHKLSTTIGATAVACLGHIRSATDAIGLFTRRTDGAMTRHR